MSRLLFVLIGVVSLSCSKELPLSQAKPSSSELPAGQTAIGCSGTFDIELVFLPGEQPLGEEERGIIQQAAQRWESVITGDIPDISFVRDPLDEYSPFLQSRVQFNDWVDDILIFVRVRDLPNDLGGSAWISWTRREGDLPIISELVIDPSQLEEWVINEGIFYKLVLHEIGHCLGFGIMTWTNLDLISYSTFAGKTYTYFEGLNARSQYLALRGEKNNPGLVVPLEKDAAHWSNEIFGDELMGSKWISPYDKMFSKLTIAAMQDIGYQVNLWAADERYTLPPRRATAKPLASDHTTPLCQVIRIPPQSR